MKKYHAFPLLLLFFMPFTASSCYKEDPEPNRVPITTIGENTLGEQGEKGL